MAGGLTEANRRALAAVRARAGAPERGPDAPITLNFHPDRLAGGRSVAQALLEDGVYRNQFETGISNGGLGADRDRWEHAMFAGAYDSADPSERPKYGGLNVMRHPGGACPAFGSCHLRLRPTVNERATFTPGDSALEPTAIGTIDAFRPVAASLRDAGPEYVEAQVHGPVQLDEDVEAVVLDPAYEGRAEGDLLRAAAERHGFAVEWHPGFALAVEQVPTDAPTGATLRWQLSCAHGRARRLAERLAPHGTLDAPTVIGAMARVPAVGPERDALKDLWTLVVVGGRL